MAQSLVVDGPSSSKTSAGLANKWGCTGRGGLAIPGLYYMMVAPISLLTAIICNYAMAIKQ